MNSPPPDRDRPADELSPAEEERVRRLLVEARAEEPMPAEVAERMDATLADLARDRDDLHAGVPESERPAGPVSALSSRRRRVVGGLVAAAVVIVVGVGIGQVVVGTDQTQDTATSNGADRSGATVDDDAMSAEGGAGSQEDRAESPSAADVPAPIAPSVRIRRVDRPVPVVRPERLHDDAIRLRRDLVPAGGRRAATYQRTVVMSPNGFKCSGHGWGAGAFVGVEYDGRLAMLAYREPTGKQQFAEVLQCGTGDLLRSTSIPAP